MTASEQAKQAGLKSLAELSGLTLMPIRTLQDWHKSNNQKFQRLCEMASAWNDKNGDKEAKVVLKKAKQFGGATLCRLMDDCLPEEIETESDMQNLIDKLWPALVCEHEV